MYPSVHSSTIYKSQDMETTQVPINRQLAYKDVVHINNGLFLSHKKVCEVMDMKINLTVVIISQGILISRYHIVHLKYI